MKKHAGKIVKPLHIKSIEISLDSASGKAFKVVVNIMDSWGCSHKQAAALLNMDQTTFEQYIANLNLVSLTPEQRVRVSYLLNIYELIVSIFNNTKNIDGFMTMKNNNEVFNGQSPLSFILSGDLEHLEITYHHVYSLMS